MHKHHWFFFLSFCKSLQDKTEERFGLLIVNIYAKRFFRRETTGRQRVGERVIRVEVSPKTFLDVGVAKSGPKKH